ncbi:hypothetical protein AVEN_77748-1 [Araneus ventricosus]|uniref:Uncharacterized protein n=1 Tax=Araneus ventricosus TaxID=182803 RepID=A0A4Y2TUM0_ARAVE|nr:hypothetical protein AVEN_77748-1 [Araneus ventricosus]
MFAFLQNLAARIGFWQTAKFSEYPFFAQAFTHAHGVEQRCCSSGPIADDESYLCLRVRFLIGESSVAACATRNVDYYAPVKEPGFAISGSRVIHFHSDAPAGSFLVVIDPLGGHHEYAGEKPLDFGAGSHSAWGILFATSPKTRRTSYERGGAWTCDGNFITENSNFIAIVAPDYSATQMLRQNRTPFLPPYT